MKTTTSMLHELQVKIRELDYEIAGKQGDYEQRMADIRAAGRTLADLDATEAKGLVALGQMIDAMKDDAIELRDRQRSLARDVADGRGSDGGVAMQGGLRLGFGAVDLRAAHDALRAGQMWASITGSEAPFATVPEFRLDEVFPWLRETVRIADLFPIKAALSRKVIVFRVSQPANAAAAWAEGSGDKPESTPEWEQVEFDVEVIAHTARISKLIIDDFTQWERIVAHEMISGLIHAENQEIISGSGASPHLHGILNTSGIGSVSRDTTNESRVEALHRGITAVRVNGFTDPTAIVLHPNDLQQVRFEKSDGSGEYLCGTPLDARPRELWGVPVLPTTDIPEGTALVGNFEMAGRIEVRQATTLEANPWAGQEFRRNEVLLRCEERLALGIEYPDAICEVVLD